MSAALSVIYLISYACAFCAIILYPKSTERERLLTWIPVGFFLLMAFDGLVAGVCTLLQIPVALASQLIGHLLLIAGIGIVAFKVKRIQRLFITKLDIVFLIIFSLICLVVIRMEFGADFTPHYLVTDPINHFRQSLRIYLDGTVSGMYQAWNFIASAIGVSSAFINFDYFYKVYCATDAIMWFFSGLLFYAAACETLSRDNVEIFAGVFCVLYTLGYPLNGMIWGFCYLGIGVSFSVLAALFCKRMLSNRNGFFLFGFSLSLFALVTSYALFAPFVYLSLFMCTTASFSRNGKLFKPQNIALFIALFAIPGLLGSWFFYDGILSSGAVTFSNALDNEGGMYRNLYSNLVLFFPLIIVSLWNLKHSRAFVHSPNAILFLLLCIGFVAMLVPAYYHAISTYYLGKMQFAIWPFALLLSASGAQAAIKLPGKILLGAYSAVFSFLCIMVVGGVDQRFAEAYQPIGVGTPAAYHSYLDIYRWNLDTMRTSGEISSDVWSLFHEAADYVSNGEEVPIIAAGMYSGWYYDITCQLDEIRSVRVNSNDPDEVLEQIMQDGYRYVAVVTIPYGNQGDNGASIATQALLSQDNSSIVFQNDAGYIVEINS